MTPNTQTSVGILLEFVSFAYTRLINIKLILYKYSQWQKVLLLQKSIFCSDWLKVILIT